MDIIHLRSLLIGIVQSLEAYLLHIINQQVDVTMLYPSTPALTRYAESIYPFMKKKFVQPTTLEEKMTIQLNTLTLPKLCVKLNTLHYIRNQLDTLEDTIKQSWNIVQSDVNVNLSACNGSVDELFAIFDNVRRGAVTTSEMMLDFIGLRVIFWDMRDSFLFSLYGSSVDSARLEIFLPLLDQVLEQICDLIIDELRDQVVLKIFRASMGLFIANGQGLPFDVVEKEARLARQILDLFALKADTIIEMLVSASEQASYHLKPTTSGKVVQMMLKLYFEFYVIRRRTEVLLNFSKCTINFPNLQIMMTFLRRRRGHQRHQFYQTYSERTVMDYIVVRKHPHKSPTHLSFVC